MTLQGFDVSHHQGAVDFARAAASGRAFVVIKATEGTGYTDPNMAGYRRAARAAGLVEGLYHYAGSSTTRTVYPAAVEAAYFVEQVGPLAVGEFVVLDFEPAVPPRSPVQWAKEWLDAVTAALGPRPLIYMNQTVRDRYDWSPITGDYGLWLAKYDGSTAAPPSGRWAAAAMKQYSDVGSVPGVSGGCDVNVFYGSAAALAAYGYQGDNMAPTAQEIAQAVWAYNIAGKGVQAQDRLFGVDAVQLPALARAIAAIPAAAATVDPAKLAAAIVAALPPELAQQVVDELAKRLNHPAA